MLEIKDKRFHFKKKLFVPIGVGMNDPPAGPLLDTLITSGVNQFNIAIAPTTSCPAYNYQQGRTHVQNWGGWSQRYFDQITALAKKLLKKNCILVLVIFSTCMRKIVKGEGRWHLHLFNEKNGGMLPANKSAVTSFYNLQNSELITAQKRLIDKIIYECKDLTNVGIAMQWEISIGYNQAKSWAIHMLKYIHKVWPGPLGIGSPYGKELEEISAGVGFPLFGILEAHNIMIGLQTKQYTPPRNNPLIYIGFHPRKEATYSRGKPERKCQVMKPGQEKRNVIESAKTMVTAFQAIGCSSLPFPQYWHHLSARFKQDCKKHGIEKYDLPFVKKELIAFTRKFAKAIKKGKDPTPLIPSYSGSKPDPVKPSPVKPQPVKPPAADIETNQEDPIMEENMRVKLFTFKNKSPYVTVNWNNWWSLTPWYRKLYAAWLLLLHIAVVVHVIVWVT